MKLQTLTLNGKNYVLVPKNKYVSHKEQIDKLILEDNENEFVPFKLENFFDNKITLARIKAGLTQEQLAKLMGVTQSYISKIEKDENISALVLKKVNDAIKSSTKMCASKTIKKDL